MKRFVDFVGSRRFAVYLLLATTAVILLSNLLPNFSVMKAGEIKALKEGRPLLYAAASSLQLGKVVRSPFFFILPAVIFLSITVCTVKRIKRWGMESGREGNALPEDMFLRAAEESLRGKGWSVEVRSQGSGEGVVITGFKGRKGFWGSVAFHAGMNVVLIGAVFSLFTRYNGSMVLADGYGVTMDEAFLSQAPKDFRLKGAIMEDFRAVYQEGFPVDYSMALTLLGEEDREKREEVGVNRPLKWMGYQFAPVRYGFSPRFAVRKGETVLLDSYINLVVMTPEKTDVFEIPGEGMKVEVQFFPDFYMEGKIPKTRSREPKNPVFFAEIKKGKEVIGRGFLHLNQEVSFAGYSIAFNDLKMWVMFSVSRDYGVPVVTFGFLLIIIGLIIKFVWHEKSVWLIFKDGTVEFGGSSRYFPALFEEELKRLGEELKAGARSKDLRGWI